MGGGEGVRPAPSLATYAFLSQFTVSHSSKPSCIRPLHDKTPSNRAYLRFVKKQNKNHLLSHAPRMLLILERRDFYRFFQGMKLREATA